MSHPTCSALVLAGSRGAADPVARHTGERHKALVRLEGATMLVRVLRALEESHSVGHITICIEDGVIPAAGDPELDALMAAGDIDTIGTGATPCQSVIGALHTLPDPLPLLVTTADHPLLTAAMVDHFCGAVPAAADVAAGLVEEAVIRDRYPDVRRTYYRFAGTGYSGGNLFLLRSAEAEQVAAFWSQLERHRKQPWRLVAAIGPLVLLRFLLGCLSLDAAMAHLSTRMGASIAAIQLPFAEAAIDVDKPADLALAGTILRQRQ